jgi:hypothetical protein
MERIEAINEMLQDRPALLSALEQLKEELPQDATIDEAIASLRDSATDR